MRSADCAYTLIPTSHHDPINTVERNGRIDIVRTTNVC